MGNSPKSEFYNSISLGLPLIQGNADIENRKTHPRFYTSHVTQKCFYGDAVLSVRAPVGIVATSVHEACIGRGVAIIRAKKNLNSLLFINSYFSLKTSGYFCHKVVRLTALIGVTLHLC